MSSPFVLVVEDNETNQMLTMAVLQRDGFRVKVAGTAEEALAIIDLEGPDIILMDLQLPGQDGLSFTRALKEDQATAAIPVVAMTAHVMLGDEAQAMAAGCAGYIAKPIDTRTLSDQVRRYLRIAR
jgi:CheY-like chemotaxis protein